MTTALTDDLVRGWSLRVPQLLIAAGLPLTVAVVLFLPADDIYYSSVADVVSVHNFVFSLLSALSFGAALLAWAVPRVSLWVFVTACLLGALGAANPHEVAAGGIWLLVAIVDGLLALRQSAMAAEWRTEPVDPPTRERIESLDGLWRWESIGIFAVALVAATFCLGWWVHARGDLISFDDRAMPSSAVITTVDTFEDSLRAEVDGKPHDFWVNDAAEYAVGDRLPVRVDPAGDYPPMGPEDADPRGIDEIGPLAAPLMLLGLLVLCTPRHRDRSRLRLARSDRALRVHVRPWAEDGVEISTPDGRRIALAMDVLALGVDDADGDEVDEPDGGLTILGEGPRRTVEVDLADLPPGTDLDTWLDETPDEELLDTHSQPTLIPGLERYGRPVIIEVLQGDGTSMTLLPARPIRDPHSIRSLIARIGAAAPFLPHDVNGTDEHVDENRSMIPQSLRAALAQIARPTHVIGPLACLTVSYFIARWFATGEEIDTLVDGAFSAFLGASLGWPLARWYSVGRPVVRLGRWGVLVAGIATDRLVPDHRIVDATAGAHSVSIHLRQPDESIGLILDPDRTTPAETNHIVHVAIAARERARPPSLRWSFPEHLPSPGVVIIGATAVACLLGTVLP